MSIKTTLLLATFALGLSFAATQAHAQSTKKATASKKLTKPIYPPKTLVLDFNGGTITGGSNFPGGEIFTGRPPRTFAHLFTLRQHWKKKAAQSVNEL